MRYPFASLLIQEVAPPLGISVELEPEFGFAGELIFPSGKRHLFRNTNFNLNPAGSTEIAKDKAYTNYFLRKHGFNVPEGQTFFSGKLLANLSADKRRGIDEAVQYASSIGFPVFVKPNNLSQGAFVTKTYRAQELVDTACEIFTRTNVMLVEKPCAGRDYRVVVLGERIISAYERIPLSVVGDGHATIEELLQQAKLRLQECGRPNSEIDMLDPRLDVKLGALRMSRMTVPKAQEKVFLLDNANLSTGGTSVDVTDDIHSGFSALAIAASRAIGLRLAGVDIICEDLSVAPDAQQWNLIELNAAPGLDNYASLGDRQAERVRELYREVLGYLASHEP